MYVRLNRGTDSVDLVVFFGFLDGGIINADEDLTSIWNHIETCNVGGEFVIGDTWINGCKRS